MSRTSVWLAASLIGALSVSGISQAQNAQGGSGTGSDSDSPSQTVRLETVVVTAQKTAQNLQNVPIAVTALSASQLSSANIQYQTDLPKLTPDLNFTANSGFISPYIRGVGSQFANPGLEDSVAVYLDDMYLPRATSGLFAFNDVQQIEVLKGPQGTLYGRNAAGGAIHIVTADPQLGAYHEAASATVGSYGTRNFDGMVNIPIKDDMALLFTAEHNENDGYVRNLDPTAPEHRLMNVDAGIYMAKFLFQQGPYRFKLSADYEGNHDSDTVAAQNIWPGLPEQIGAAFPPAEAGGCVLSAGFYTVCNDGLDYVHASTYGGEARFDYDAGPATLSSITAFRGDMERNCEDIDATGAFVEPVCGAPWTRQYTEELEAISNGPGPWHYIGGLFYLYERSAYPFSVQSASLPAGYVLQSSGQGVRVNSFAPYAQGTYDFTKKLSLTGGLRYTVESKQLLGSGSYLAQVDPATGFPLPGGTIIPASTPCSATVQTFCVPSPFTERVVFHKVTPEATLTYKPLSNLMLYATYKTGFKSGGLNLPSFGNVSEVKPETLTDYEVGWKTQFDHTAVGPIRWNGGAFLYNYRDLQVQLTDQQTGGTLVENAADARIYGVENEVTWAPTEPLLVGLGASYLFTEYRDFTNGDAYYPCAEVPSVQGSNPTAIATAEAQCASQGGLGLGLVPGINLSGKKLADAPPYTAYLHLQYTYRTPNWGSVVLSAIGHYQDTAYFDFANQFEDKARTTLSANVTWNSENGHYYVSVYGDNLTGVKYYSIISPQSTGGWEIPAPPLEVFVKAGLSF